MLGFADGRQGSRIRSSQSVDATQPQRLTAPQLVAAIAGIATLVALIVVIGLVMRGGNERSGLGIISIGRATDVRPRRRPTLC